ncbi:putative phage holin [Streptomyces griseosporeus]|uniref:putative phage holin n=1 Tax=Streptomyces griseosporeus TaxID=1910 RepID=UPI0037011B85
MDWAQIANIAASGLVALCALVFAGVYHLHAPWRSTAVGRHVMTFTVAVGALGAYTVLVTIWPTGPTTSVLRTARTVLLILIAGLIIQRIRMVLSAQHRGALLADPDRPEPPH